MELTIGIVVVVSVLAAMAMLVAGIRHRHAAEAIGPRHWRAGQIAGREQAEAAFADQRERLAQYERLLRSAAGGVGRRIEETRAAAHAIQKHGPELFSNVENLGRWLKGTDDFLLELLDVYAEADQDTNNSQSRLAVQRPASIYQSVFDGANIVPAGAATSTRFSVSIESGRVSIRSLGTNGAGGKVVISPRSLTRFFNDVAARPRSLSDERESGQPSSGIYRVDLPGDPRKGQLVIETVGPNSGSLFLGDPKFEHEQVAELRTLAATCQRLLGQSASPSARRATARRAQILRRDAHMGEVPANGLCPNCDGDVTTHLKLGDHPTECPLCAASWKA